MPDTVGVPLIVIVLLPQAAVTPVGKPVGVPIPVAPVLLCVMSVNIVLTQMVGVLDAVPAIFSDTVIVPVAFTLPHPPVNGML